MIRTLMKALAVLLLAGLAAPALAQQGPQEAGTFLIRHAKLYTLGKAGTLADGDLLIRDGRIAAAGANLSAPHGATIIDAHGMPVTPGLMVTGSPLGIEEVSAVRESNDGEGDAAVASAAFDAADAINPNSTLIPIARVAGVTRSLTVPGDGKSVFLGQGAVIDLGTADDLIDKRKAVMLASIASRGGPDGQSRPIAWIKLREMIDEAREYWAHKDSWGRPGASRDQRSARVDLEALGPVLKGQVPVLIEADRASDIRAAIAYGKSAHLRLVIKGASEGWMVAKELAAAHVPVMIDPQRNLPVSFADIGATLKNAARLDAAGVTVILTPDRSPHFARTLTQVAGDAVAYGMPWEHALAAISRTPAEVFGVAARYGTLDPGKDGDVVIWDGDPLELTSAPTAVFIKGARMPMVTRQTELRDRYRHVGEQQALPFAYQ